MQLCSVVWLFLLCFAPVCLSAEKHLKCSHDKHAQIHQKTRGTKKFCDPSLNNQAAGAVTQKCSPGSYREREGPYRGQCVPCGCNGLSNECDERTGNCVNCQFNTTGDRCERCKEGFYGKAAHRTCRACPCPFTSNNFAVACLDIGAGVVECLCKRGYSGARCERCAFGYYGNPMTHGGSCKPCNCEDGTLNICDSLTGECITSGDSSCHECDSCTLALLADLERADGALAQLKRQLEKTSDGSLSKLNCLQANISDTKTLAGRYGAAVRHLDPKVEQLEADVDVVGADLSPLIDEALKTASDLEKILQVVNETTLRTDDLLSEGETLITTIQDLIKQLTEVKPGESAALSENNKTRMMEEAQRILQEMRERGCSAQRDKAGREQEDAHTFLDIIRINMTAPVETNQAVLNQTAHSLMALEVFLKDLAGQLSDAEDAVNRTRGLNLENYIMLQHLEMEREQHKILPVVEMIADLLKNITDIFLTLEEKKKECEHHAAQLDGAKPKLLKKLNNMAKVDTVTTAEEHAEELCRRAAEFQQALYNATNTTDMFSFLDAHNNTLEKAEMAANQSGESAEGVLKHVTEGRLVSRVEALKDNSTFLWMEANETQSDLKMLSHRVKTHTGRVNKQKEKGASLIMDISAVSDNLRSIKRGDTEVLIESVKMAASSSDTALSNITEKLRNISQEVERITSTNASVTVDNILNDADQTLKNLSATFPALKDKITQVEALSEKVPPSVNMTESIRRIKDLIEETRNFVDRVSLATTFNGKGHMELRPPRNLEDIKAFTAIDLLLNRHRNKSDSRRMRRQRKSKDGSFVFYLGNKNISGDYIGMAIKSSVLISVYKLGGVVHEFETSQITTTTNVNSSDFDRVFLHRVYQDAEVNITQNFTSQKPVSLPPKRHLPDTVTGILELDPESIVFYVGGYPEDFTPPVELHYPKYRGAMKLSYINDNPVCLFNYKHAANMDEQPIVKIPQSELSDYYEGTGYRMAFLKEPGKKKILFKFHINSRETNALLFYIGNEESFFCVFVERGFLVLQGQQAGEQLKVQSAGRVSLFDKNFAITVGNKFTVHYGQKQISTEHSQTNYLSFYVGGLAAQLRHRHNITAPPLRGCVDYLKVDAEVVEYNRTIGVSRGCPVSQLGVRSAMLSSALSVGSLFVGGEQPLRVSLGFRSTVRHGTLLSSRSQGSTSVHNLHLSLYDGYAVLHSDNYTLRSDKRYSDGSWHYLSAVRMPTGLQLSIDNEEVIHGQSPDISPVDSNLKGGKFKGCISNLYARRSANFLPADLSLFSLTGGVDLGLCRLHLSQNVELLPAPVLKKPQKHKLGLAGSQCKPRWAHRGEFHLYEDHSWLSYNVSQEDLNHRPHFSLDIKTKSSKGLILHAAGRGAVPLLALYMANGKIKMSLGQNRIIHHKQKSNDGKWHKVEFSVEKSTFHLLVDGLRVTDGHLPANEGSSLDLHNPVYLGADPKGKTTQGHSIPVSSVIGCVRDFRMNEVVVGEAEASHKTAPCLDVLTETGTYFGGGHMALDYYFTFSSQFTLDFELRPEHLTGLLFHARSSKASLDVYLMENKVGVKVNDGSGAVSISVTPHESLCDGEFHTVTVSKKHDAIKLEVDSTSKQRAVPFMPTSNPETPETLYIGGTTKKNQAAVSLPFVGCLRNVKLNGKPVAFETGSRVVEPVSINRCPPD